MADKKYIKKVIVNDQNASAEERAKRLRKIRNLANLSRKEICDSEELNLNTYKGWELARFGGLPIDGAERVITRVARENIVCTPEWLLYGKGIEPYILPQKKDISEEEKNNLILKEILLFQSLHHNSVYTEIKDDSLAPDYLPGDFVAGIIFRGEDISNILDQNCIVELENGDILVRYLKKGAAKHCYKLIATNINCDITSPMVIESRIKFAAPIIRHYKQRPIFNKIQPG